MGGSRSARRVLVALVLAAAGAGSVLVLPAVGVKAAPPASNTLSAGATLPAGQELESADGHYTLRIGAGGSLAEVWGSGGRTLWSTPASVTGGADAVMETNGNLVLFNADAMALWSSGTDRAPGAYAAMQSDGNLSSRPPPARRYGARTPSTIRVPPSPSRPMATSSSTTPAGRCGHRAPAVRARGDRRSSMRRRPSPARLR
jgi:hypothetical protein